MVGDFDDILAFNNELEEDCGASNFDYVEGGTNSWSSFFIGGLWVQSEAI